MSERPRDGMDLGPVFDRLDGVVPIGVRGRVVEVTGLVIKARVPGVRIGELCHIETPLRDEPVRAEVVGFKSELVYLMALGDLTGIGPDSEVRPSGHVMTVKVGGALLGRVLNGLGQPADGKGPLDVRKGDEYPIYAPPPDPMTRRRVLSALPVGIRAIDGLLTVGEGQRIGIFAAAGGGKSTLLGMIARNTAADVNVIALVGERGREVLDFIEESLGKEGLARSVVVVATSDQPTLVRLKSAYVATAVAEYFRDRGKRVVLIMDSITRFARAQREAGLAIGEPPARAGFPPSVFATLPRLLERAGNSERGSITAFYTVLVEGDDMTEPVADETRSILDGHIILSRDLAARGHYPAIDVLRSASRVMPTVAAEAHLKAAQKVRELVATYERNRDLILLGAYKRGTDARADEALERWPGIEAWLRQGTHERSGFDDGLAAMTAAGGGA